MEARCTCATRNGRSTRLASSSRWPAWYCSTSCPSASLPTATAAYQSLWVAERAPGPTSPAERQARVVMETANRLSSFHTARRRETRRPWPRRTVCDTVFNRIADFVAGLMPHCVCIAANSPLNRSAIRRSLPLFTYRNDLFGILADEVLHVVSTIQIVFFSA